MNRAYSWRSLIARARTGFVRCLYCLRCSNLLNLPLWFILLQCRFTIGYEGVCSSFYVDSIWWGIVSRSSTKLCGWFLYLQICKVMILLRGYKWYIHYSCHTRIRWENGYNFIRIIIHVYIDYRIVCICNACVWHRKTWVLIVLRLDYGRNIY